ncbi:MAG: ATP-binding protein [Bacteroides sp.]|nr:ATP-binding protein [Bacteroides sp.]
MKFYNRNQELAELQSVRELAFAEHSKLTVLTGRRRIGKTSLILKSCENTTTVYWFVKRSNEADLCAKFAEIASQELGIAIPGTVYSFTELFEFIMEAGTRNKFNLVIDEFQEFFNINPSIYSGMQDIWDRYRTKTNVNLIVSGSVYTLMEQIFKDAKEPLYGRSDRVLKLYPFTTDVMKEILHDYKPHYHPDDLLALYTFTGGVPKYIELLMDAKATDMEKMVNFMIQPDSPFLDEGDTLLIQEFGKKYGNYFSVIGAIADGRNTLPEMEERLGISLGGYLKRLEEDYNIVVKKRPILSKEGTQTVRYGISDPFLRFWFRYFNKYQSLLEIRNFDGLATVIKKDYPTYSGLVLEEYFRQKMIESGEFLNIGSWWEAKGNANEIDIVGIYLFEKKALVAEVKRQRKNFKPELFQQKVEAIRQKLLFKYEIESKCLTLEDM